MNAFWSFIQNWYHRIINSIALLPAIIALLCLFLAFTVVTIEYDPFAIDIKKRISYLLITNREEARLVLGTLVASIISLMVFSFSMVMVVLSRASSDLSPRVLPGLISNKTHQFILGLYLGTIIYTLILITNFQSETDYRIPSLGVLIAMILGIMCLWLFIYFIHSISQNIQVENILEQIFKRTCHALKHERDAIADGAPADIHIDDSWTSVETVESGYLVKSNISSLTSLAKEHDVQIAIMRNSAFFFVKGYPFVKIRSDSPLDPELVKKVRQSFLFALSDQLSDHFIFGFRQISEIAVKALSPGINDPGTALKALDHLALLFIDRIDMPHTYVVRDDKGTPRLIHAPVTFSELLFRNLAPIREFGKSDVMIQLRILALLKDLLMADLEKARHTNDITAFIHSCIESADINITNTLDRKELNEVILTLGKYLPGHLGVAPLSIGA